MSEPSPQSMLLSHLGFTKKRIAYEVALKDKKQIAEDTMEFVFEKPKEFQYKAGQHVRVTLIDPPETDSQGDRRFFSLASSPSQSDLIFAMRMSNSAFKRVLGSMPTGSKVRIEMLVNSPHGSFALHDDVSKPAVFLVGGIGIVPAFSMIKDWAEQKLPHKIILFYSNRRPEDAPYLSELEALAKQFPALKLIATITKPEKLANTWQGETGHINQAMLQKYVDDLEAPIYYVAGLTAMVDAMRTMLTGAGIKADRIHAEEFSGFKMSLKDDDAYTCPMHPEILAAQPDQCPKCGMALVPNKNTGSKSHAVSKKHLLIAITAIAIIGFAILHLVAVGSIHTSIFSPKSPISYLLLFIFLVVAAFKLKFLWSLSHSKGKSMLELHGLRRRNK